MMSQRYQFDLKEIIASTVKYHPATQQFLMVDSQNVKVTSNEAKSIEDDFSLDQSSSHREVDRFINVCASQVGRNEF